MQGVSPKELTPYQRCSVLLIALLALPMQPFVLGSHVVERFSRSSELPTAIQAFVTEPTIVEVAPAEAAMVPEANSEEPISSSNLPVRPESRGKRSVRGQRKWGSATSSNGHFLIEGTTGQQVFLTNLVTNKTSDLSSHGLTSVAFFPSGDSFVAGGSDGRVTIWSAPTSTVIQDLYMHDDVVRSVAVSPQGNLVAIGGRDGSVKLINLAANQVKIELSRTEAAVNCVRFSRDGQRLAVAVGDWNSTEPGQVVILNLEAGRVDTILPCNSAPGAVCFVSNDGDELIVGEWNGQTTWWNLANRKVIRSAMTDKNYVAAASFSPDNPVLWLAARQNDVSFVEPATATPTLEVPETTLERSEL